MSAPVDGMTDDARAAVAELLDLRGQPITLITAGTAVEKPGGGKDYQAGTARTPQMFAIFNKQALDVADDARTDRGAVRRFQMEMVGAHDAVVAIGDHWEDFAARYVVDTVDVTRAYQITAVVLADLKPTAPPGTLPYALPVTLSSGG